MQGMLQTACRLRTLRIPSHSEDDRCSDHRMCLLRALRYSKSCRPPSRFHLRALRYGGLVALRGTSFACRRARVACHPKLAAGERRMVDLTGIEPVTS